MYKGLLIICLAASTFAVDSSTECKGWVDCERQRLKNLINIPASVAKGSIDIIKDGSKLGMDIANTAADYSSGIGHTMLDGGLILANKSIEASANLLRKGTKLANEIMDENNIPLKKYVEKATQVVDKGSEIMEGVGNFGIATTHQAGSAVIQTTNGVMHVGNSVANNVLQKTAEKAEKVIDFSAGVATKTVDKAADLIKSIFKV